jgi:hypothetical protein
VLFCANRSHSLLNSELSSEPEVVVSEDSSTIIVSSSYPSKLFAWDTATGKLFETVFDLESVGWSSLSSLSVSYDGSRIAGGLFKLVDDFSDCLTFVITSVQVLSIISLGAPLCIASRERES